MLNFFDPFDNVILMSFFQVTEPPVRKAGGFVADVNELISKLKEKGFVKA